MGLTFYFIIVGDNISIYIDFINKINETCSTKIDSRTEFDEQTEVEKSKSRFEDSIRKMQVRMDDINEDANEYLLNNVKNDFSSIQELKQIDEKIAFANRNSKFLDWEGEEGNSKRKPKDYKSDLAKELSKFGVDGIEYKNGDVDFSPVSKYTMDFETENELYKYLGENISIGELISDSKCKSRSDFNNLIRSKWQSMVKEQIVDKLSDDPEFASDFQHKTGVDISSVKSTNGLLNELKRNGLTLHESPDCKKIQFIPTIIHNAFKHSGGTAEMIERLIDGDMHGRINKNS